MINITPLELIIILTICLLLILIGMLAQIGWEHLYTNVIYYYTLGYKATHEKKENFNEVFEGNSESCNTERT